MFAFTQPVSQSPVNWTAARKSKARVKERLVSGFAVLKGRSQASTNGGVPTVALQGSVRRAGELTQPPGRASTSSHALAELMSSPR